MRPMTPNFNFGQQARPSSPPETPTTSTFGKPILRNRRYGIQNFSHHLHGHDGNIELREQGPNFSYNSQVRSADLSPHSSTPSSESSGSPPRSLISELGEPVNESPPRTHTRIVTEGNFTVEEFGESDYEGFDSDDEEVIRPHQYEDAESDHARSVKTANDLDAPFISGFRNLDCGDEDVHEDHQAWLEELRAEKRRKRRSSGSVQKRTLTQSIGSGTDDEDLQPVQFDANEAGSSIRRLRRKVAVDSSGLTFDDPPPRIPELEEPESCEEVVEADDVDDGQAVDMALPFYVLDMDVDSDEE